MKETYKNIVFSSSNSTCTFDIAITLVNNTTISPKADVNSIKYKLVEKYQELFRIHPAEIVIMFDYYGYINLSRELANSQITIENIIMNTDYHLTTFDLLLISEIYEIPLTMITSTTYIENKMDLITMNAKQGNTYIVITPLVNKYENNIPSFKLIINKKDEALIDITKLPEESMRNKITSQTNTIIDLLKSFQNKNIPDDTKLNNMDKKKIIKKKIRLKLL
jgi:hypothetical protein